MPKIKEKLPTISVIVATKNEERNVERIIASVKKQQYPENNVELIFVDNGSTDLTLSLLKKSKVKFFELAKERSLKGVKNFRGAQVNFGVDKSKGEIIFFPDADMTFDSGLFLETAKLLSKKFDALYVPEVVVGRGYFGKIRNFERSFYNQTPIDAVRFVKKDFFQKIGGFDVKNIVFAPDDWDLTKMLKKAGAKLGITKKPLFHHEEWLTLGIYLSKKEKYLNTFNGYIKKWGVADPDIKKQFGLSYRYFGVFLEFGKWRKIIRHPILSASMFFVRFLVGAKYLMFRLRNYNSCII